MKGTTPRILSFLMALALLASTFAAVAGPVGVAEASTNNTFDAVNPAVSRSFATVAGDNIPFFIAISPNYAADKTLYAAVSTGGGTTGALSTTKIVRSNDGGISWSNGLNPLTGLTVATDLVRGLDVASNGTLVLLVTASAANPALYGAAAATTNQALIFRSTDGGSTWTNHSVSGAGALLGTASITAASVTGAVGAIGGNPVGFAVAPSFASNGQVIVALANGNVARYDQNRANWEAMAFNTVITGAALSVAFHPNYASNEEIWTLGNTAAGPTAVVARIERLNAAAAVGGTLDGATNAWDGGRIKFDRSGVVWVGGRRAAGKGGNILELVGSTWTNRGAGLGLGWGAGTGLADAVSDFAIVSGTGSTARIVVTLWSPVTSSIYTRLTRSGGQTPGWTSTFSKQPGDVRGLATADYRPIVVGPDGLVWVGNADSGTVGNRGGLFAGKFSGSDFSFGPMGLTTATFAPAGIVDLDASPNYGTDNTVSITTDEGVWLSTNLGPSTAAADIGWRLAFPATGLVGMAFSNSYASDRTIYTVNSGTSGNKGFRSFDGGFLWETMKTTRDDGMPADSAAFRKIISGGSGILYAITDDSTNPFAVSTNQGDNWASKGPANGLNASDARDVAAQGATVAVGVRAGGTVQVFVSKDTGATFTRVGTRNMGGAAADVRVFVSPNYATDGVVIAGARDATSVGTVDVSYGDLYRSVKDADWVRIDTSSNIASGTADVSTNVLQVAGTATPINRLYTITTTGTGLTGTIGSMSNYVTGGGGGSGGGFRGPCSSAGVGTATSTFSAVTGAGCSAPSGALAVVTGTLISVGTGGTAPVLFVSLGAANWLARISDLGVTAPTLSSPVDARGFVQDPVGTAYNDISLRWNSVSGMDAGAAYEVDVSEDPAFPSFGSTIRGRNMIIGNTTSWTYNTTLVDVQMPTLERGKKYYWRVRVGDGAFSAVRSFSFDMLRPILSRPDNGTDVNSLNVFFAWKSTGIGAAGTETSIEADRTAFELTTDVNFAAAKTKRVEFESLALAYEVEAPLVANTTYYWRVQGGKIRTDAKGVTSTIWGAFGGPYSFRTPPAAVTPPPVGTVPGTGTPSSANVAAAFASVATKIAVIWSFDEKTQSWSKYDPKAPPFANSFSTLTPYGVVLIIATDNIAAFQLGSVKFDLVKGNNYKPYIP